MTLAIAHRGNPVQFRENTLPALRAAASAGVDMAEIDLRLTGDGYVVLLRDDSMEHLWGLSRPVSQLGLAELAALGDAGDHRIPTLLEVLAEFGPSHPVRFMLNAVSVDTALAADDLVQELGLAEKAIYTGSIEAMRTIRSRRPHADLALTWDRAEPPGADLWRAVRPRFYNLYHPLITRELVAEAHRHGCGVCAWTVNDFTEMARLLGMGVDAIVTDYPDELTKLAAGSYEHVNAGNGRTHRAAAEPGLSPPRW